MTKFLNSYLTRSLNYQIRQSSFLPFGYKSI